MRALSLKRAPNQIRYGTVTIVGLFFGKAVRRISKAYSVI